MKVSVLMSTFNGEKYIGAQLMSLLNQTRKINELIIADDCSTDKTINIVLEFIETYGLGETWKVFVNGENKGWRTNFIENISRTTGDILFFCDQDDVWFDNKVEITAGILERYPEISVAASRETLWFGKIEIHTHTASVSHDVLELSSSGENYFIQCSGCTMAVKRTYINKVLKYHRAGWAHDDFFWKMGVMDGKLALLKNPTILHRIHGNNQSRKKRNLKSSLEGIGVELMIVQQLETYLADTAKIRKLTTLNSSKHIISHKKEGNEVRKEFFCKKKIRLLLKLMICYSDIYRKKKQILGDLLLIYGFRK